MKALPPQVLKPLDCMLIYSRHREPENRHNELSTGRCGRGHVIFSSMKSLPPQVLKPTGSHANLQQGLDAPAATIITKFP
ncbi:hypothetical protein XELAEV_18008810mg [Xenopus laevis]|uniref:Uncharacterized protein n=1 Tax=Xenopus laevis TaxID=8355 RepID=A0A974I001_XENLA|nr:hypothetical protein XELAEV_18008810mg [Xenopus laevis]